MGVERSKFYYLKRLSSFDFIITQGFWKQKRDLFNNVFNYNMLGLRYDFNLLKSNMSLEYMNRCIVVCFNLLLNKSNILFLIPYLLRDRTKISFELKELAFYFCLRSLQPYYSNENIKELLAYDYVRNTCVILVFYTDFYNFLIKQALHNLMPIICFENDNILERDTYSIIGNSDSIYFLSLCYRNISNSMLKAMLLSCFINK